MISAFLVMLGLGGTLAAYVAWVEPRQVRTRRFRVATPNLRHPLRVVTIGDLQPNVYHWPPERLGALFSRLMKDENPDLVLWLGDYYNAPTDVAKPYLEARPDLHAWVARRLPVMEEIAHEMAKLKGRLGSFAILGNHDWAWSGYETERHLEERGISVLKDDIATVSCPETGQGLQILGYEDMSSGRRPKFDDLHAALDPTLPQIALGHTPDTFPAAKGGPPLMLSGHTHGGQVRIPGIGPVVLPVEHRRYDRGWFDDGARRLYVTSGLGTSLPPLRFMVPPEVVVLDLVPARPGELPEA